MYRAKCALHCKSFGISNKNFMSDNKIDSLKKSIGPNTWSLLHTIAATYPERPSTLQQKNAKQFYHRIAEFYPCGYCAKDFREAIKQHPVRTESREALSV